MESIDALQDALAQFKGGVITVSHDERFIQSVCNEIWVCEGGTLKQFPGTIKDYKVSYRKRYLLSLTTACSVWSAHLYKLDNHGRPNKAKVGRHETNKGFCLRGKGGVS